MKSDKTVCLYNYINEFSLYFTFFGMQDMYTLIVDMNVPLFRLELSVIISLVYHVYIENIYFCQVYNKLLLLFLIWCWHLNLKLVIWYWSWEFYIILFESRRSANRTTLYICHESFWSAKSSLFRLQTENEIKHCMLLGFTFYFR